MTEGSQTRRVVRFGAFEVDLAAGELRKSGLKIKLQEQPFQVLALFLERPGEVVTREEMRERLWPADTFVDFDRSLNISINKIREVLGDSPHHPRFIETLPRRGYRFIGQVETSAVHPAVPVAMAQRSAPLLTGIALAAAALAVAAWFWFSRSRAPQLETPMTAVPLTTYPGWEYHPSFSPDGNEIAFSWNGEELNNVDIYRKLIGQEPPLRLTLHRAADIKPAWSPDGRHIAFLRYLPDEKLGVFLTPSIGGVERQIEEITSGGAFEQLAWSPDGKWLVVSDRAAGEQPFSLFLLSVVTREKRRLTFPPGTLTVGDHGGSFSPDGRSLVFVRSQTFFVSDVYSLALSEHLAPKGQPRRMTYEGRQAHDTLWTPDGSEIIFVSGDRFSSRLWRLLASGLGELRPLAPIGTGTVQPAVSKQGHRLAYSQVVLDLDIWRVGTAGRKEQATPPEKFISSTRRDCDPSWSPDGSRIAFVSGRSGNNEIWVCSSDGSGPVQMTSVGGPHVAWPAWSPDGKLLAFETAIPGQREIYVIDADGGPPQRVTDDPSDDAMPSWSRDGKWIYFCSSRTGTPQVWRIPVKGGKAAQVTTGGGTAAQESVDGKSVYYAKRRGRTAVWKVPVAGGEESLVLDSIMHHSMFSVAERGLYFIQDRRSVRFLRFASGEVKLIASVTRPFDYFSVSPDGRWILYTQREETGADLMLVENFR